MTLTMTFDLYLENFNLMTLILPARGIIWCFENTVFVVLKIDLEDYLEDLTCTELHGDPKCLFLLQSGNIKLIDCFKLFCQPAIPHASKTGDEPGARQGLKNQENGRKSASKLRLGILLDQHLQCILWMFEQNLHKFLWNLK